jgi:anaphase-promoting complex subunit 1
MSIWPLPFGLLLQQAAEVYSPAQIPFSSSSTLLGTCDIPRHRREIGQSPQHKMGSLSAFDYGFKGDTSSMCSHLILKDPLEEPEVHTFFPSYYSYLLDGLFLLAFYFVCFRYVLCS